MPIKNFLSLVAFAIVLTGCARPLVIAPNIDKITASTTDKSIAKNAGYYVADDTRAKEVTTPGGGGDKVNYFPYRDIETAFYKMLDNVFDNVTKLKAPEDTEAISKNKLSYIVTPAIVTNSSSPSAFTWPPTKFSVELTCNITDSAGNKVMSLKVLGEGAAEFDEFKSDYSLSGRRATEDALMKMQKALLEAPELRK
jgi:hypothetical protein